MEIGYYVIFCVNSLWVLVMCLFIVVYVVFIGEVSSVCELGFCWFLKLWLLVFMVSWLGVIRLLFIVMYIE